MAFQRLESCRNDTNSSQLTSCVSSPKPVPRNSSPANSLHMSLFVIAGRARNFPLLMSIAHRVLLFDRTLFGALLSGDRRTHCSPAFLLGVQKVQMEKSGAGLATKNPHNEPSINSTFALKNSSKIVMSPFLLIISRVNSISSYSTPSDRVQIK